MTSHRIVLLREDQYSKFDHDRYGFDIFQERGFSVEFWDCSKTLRPNFQEDISSLDSDGFSGLRCFKNRNFLFDSISRLTSQDTLIPAISFNMKTLGALRTAANTKAILGMPRLGDFPQPIGESSSQGRLKKIIRRPSVVANFFLQKLSLAKLGLRPLDFVLQGGAATLSGTIAHFNGDRTKILHAHAMDYDRHLFSLNDSEENIYPENVVFWMMVGHFIAI